MAINLIGRFTKQIFRRKLVLHLLALITWLKAYDFLSAPCYPAL
jgi:hypothetical protein